MSGLKHLANRVAGALGYRISRLPAGPEAKNPVASPVSDTIELPRMESGLERTKFQGTFFNTVIDVGSSDGRWTERCMQVFPDAHYFLVEASRVHEEGLKRFVLDHPNARYVITAAGDHQGEAQFWAGSNAFAGVVVRGRSDIPTYTVPLTTIDRLVEQYELEPPFLLKLDTHGFEYPIFEGAVNTLRDTSLIIVEAYNFTAEREDRFMRFPELCVYLEERGFRCFDLVDPMYRKHDYMLWQMDLFFVPATRPEIQYTGFY